MFREALKGKPGLPDGFFGRDSGRKNSLNHYTILLCGADFGEKSNDATPIFSATETAKKTRGRSPGFLS